MCTVYIEIRKSLALIDWNDKLKKQDGIRMLEYVKGGGAR